MSEPEQFVEKDAVITPAFDEDDRKEIIEEVKQEAKAKQRELESTKSCIVCGKVATHCMRGLPNNTYCKDCAKDHFKFLNYLERL